MRSRMLALLLKGFDKLISVKFLVFLIACVFLWNQKIDQGAWVETVLIVIGARTANELVAMVRK